MGMATQEIEIGGSTTIDVTMGADARTLQEFVVTGYGLSRRSAFTGAATQVGEETIGVRSDANIINSLQGSVPGVQIQVAHGQPGAESAILIRGLSSISLTNRPLLVIDGVPMANIANLAGAGNTPVDPLSLINPNDIESITVLKDASATAIFGSRAANGVILVTTRQGRDGRTQFTFSATEGRSVAPRLRHEQRVLNREDYIAATREMLRNSPADAVRANENNEAWWLANRLLYSGFNDGIDTDWWSEVTRPGALREYSLSAQGGTEKTRFFTSGSYSRNEGYVIGTGMERFTGRLNLTNKSGDFVTFGMNASGTYGVSNNTTSSGADGSFIANPIMQGIGIAPTQPVRHTGELSGFPAGSWNYTTIRNVNHNPVAVFGDHNDLSRHYRKQELYRATISPFVQVSILPNLVFQTRGSMDWIVNYGTVVWSPLSGDGVGWNGLRWEQQSTQWVRTFTNTLNFMPEFGSHRLNFLLGQEATKFHSGYVYAEGRNFPSPAMTQLVSAATRTSEANFSQSAIMSYFSNVEYDFMDRYYLSASLRFDGSSRFHPDRRWGAFWSLGGRWRISQEDFFQPLSDVFSNAALRASYGTTGNQNVGFFAFMGLNAYGNPYNEQASMFANQLGNPDLTWESIHKFNLGTEFELFHRIGLQIDFYRNVVHDMLDWMPVSRTTGFNQVMRNVGSMSNTGVEFALNALIYSDRNFRWTAGFNATANRNKILSLPEGDFQAGNFVRAVGHPWHQLRMREFYDINPDNGMPRWKAHQYTPGPDNPMGFVKDGTYRLVTDWSHATDNERMMVGDMNPWLYGGINTRVDVHGFDFAVLFTYQIGGWRHVGGMTRNFHTGNSAGNLQNPLAYANWDNRWQNPGDATNFPRLAHGQVNQFGNGSTRWWVPGHFIKLQNITLGYTLPREISSQARLTSARIFFQADNIWFRAHKDFLGHDVDHPVAGAAGALGGQQDWHVPAAGRNWLFGLNLRF
jgi:TonB-linked SusC/RagA family outer membrane protein